MPPLRKLHLLRYGMAFTPVFKKTGLSAILVEDCMIGFGFVNLAASKRTSGACTAAVPTTPTVMIAGIR